MTWVKLDDQLHAHPKVMRAWNARPAALGLHLLALSHCGAYMTDGFIEEAFVAMKLPRKGDRDKTVATLIEVGLWERADGGYRIHDFLDYNRSKEQVEGRRRTDSVRKRGGFRTESNGNPA